MARTQFVSAFQSAATLSFEQSLAPRPLGSEADFSARGFRELGESADLREQLVERGVVRDELVTVALDLACEFVDLRCKFRVGRKKRSHANEGANDEHAYLNGAARAQHIRKHQAAVFGEGERRDISLIAAMQCGCILQPHSLPLVEGKLEHEVFREPGQVASCLLVQALGLDTIKPRQIRIQHHALAAQRNDAIRDRFNGRRFHTPSCVVLTRVAA
jgi:hypothetical protein